MSLEKDYFEKKENLNYTNHTQVINLGLSLERWVNNAYNRKSLLLGAGGIFGQAIAWFQQPEYERAADELNWYFNVEKLATREEIIQLIEKES